LELSGSCDLRERLIDRLLAGRDARTGKKQLLTYLRLADSRLGLSIDFNTALVKDGITRIVNRRKAARTQRKTLKPLRFTSRRFEVEGLARLRPVAR